MISHRVSSLRRLRAPLQECRTVTNVSIRDLGPEEIRRTVAYRAALWSSRLVYPCVFIAPIAASQGSGTTFLVAWLVGGSLAVTSLVLLRRSGVRWVRRGAGWYLDREMARNFYRDLFWLPRR